MRQILVRIPGLNLPIFGFGAMLFVAFIVCTWLAGRRARRQGIAPEYVQDMAIWLFVGGLLGARISFLLFEARPPNFQQFLWQLPRIWDGGIILYGSIVGGFLGYLAFYWYTRKRYRVPPLQMTDILAPSLALGIAFGRIGCLLNGCCFGQVACPDCVAYPVTYPLSAWPRGELVSAGFQTAAGFTYSEQDQPDKYVRVGRVEPGSAADRAGLKADQLIAKANGVTLAEGGESPAARLSDLLTKGWERGRNELTLTVLNTDGKNMHDVSFAPRTIGLHPTQLYETVSMLLLFLVLLALDPIRQRDGLMTAVLMMGYAVHRTLNELLRADTRPTLFEKLFSYFLFSAGLGLAIYVLSRGRKVPAPQPEPAKDEARVQTAGAISPA